MLNIEGKVIAITGASSGIGEATARLLASHGAKVVLGARRTRGAAGRGHGPHGPAHGLELLRDLRARVDEIARRFGR